jgi:putative membrane protein
VTVYTLPAVNAVLNASSAGCLIAGRLAISKGKVSVHRACMLTAFALSCLFLVGYLTFHAIAGTVYFKGTGAIRTVYLSILGTHTVLAVLTVPLVLRALYLAAKERFEEHRRAVRWAFPVWMYVSVTGVVVYWMLFQL